MQTNAPTIHAMRKLGELTRILDRSDLMQPVLASGHVSTHPQMWKQVLRVPLMHAKRKGFTLAIELAKAIESMELPAKPDPQEWFAFWSGLQNITPKVASGRNIG